MAFIISKNLHRRHLNESQRAMIAAKLSTLSSGQHPEIKRKKQQAVAILTAVTAEKAADMLAAWAKGLAV